MSKSVYYCRFTGDYARDTSHLSLIQHGAYTVLLDFYYSSGKPLPPDMNALCRICRAFDDAERDAVSQVVSQFFELRANGYHNKRADVELAYRAEQRDRLSKGAKKTNAKRWGKDSSLGDSLGDRIPSPSPSPSPSPNPQKPKSKPAPKPAAPADPRFGPFLEFAKASFETKHGHPPTWDCFGKDGKELAAFLRRAPHVTLDVWQTHISSFFDSTEPFTIKQGGSLSYFVRRFDTFSGGPITAGSGKVSHGKPTATDLALRNAKALGLGRPN